MKTTNIRIWKTTHKRLQELSLVETIKASHRVTIQELVDRLTRNEPLDKFDRQEKERYLREARDYQEQTPS